jgi:hypothetical protein
MRTREIGRAAVANSHLPAVFRSSQASKTRSGVAL